MLKKLKKKFIQDPSKTICPVCDGPLGPSRARWWEFWASWFDYKTIRCVDCWRRFYIRRPKQ